MKIAAILAVGALMATPSFALAQSTGSDAALHGMRAEGGRTSRATSAAVPRATNDSDRAIDAEMRRIDRMMTICTGC